GETDGRRLLNALTTSLSDVPHDRVAGAIIVTDGRVHDVPTDAASLGFSAPVHALITGRANERDRRVVLITTPRFGIVGQSQTISYRVEDQAAHPAPPRSLSGAAAGRSTRATAAAASRAKSTGQSPLP